MSAADIKRCGTVIGEHARRLNLCAHHHQHAANIRVVDDGLFSIAATQHHRPLLALAGKLDRALIGRLTDRVAFDANSQSGGIHHRKHVHQATIFLAYQVTHSTVIIAERHDAGRARVNAEFVFDRCGANIVALAGLSISIENKFRHHKQRYSLYPGWSIGGSRQHQMNDVVGHVVITIGDEDLLSFNQIVITGRFCTRPHGRQVRACLRFGEIHRAGPCTGDHFLKVGVFQRI